MKKELVPNVIVGVPTGANASDATVGFARASRRVRQLGESSPFSIDELTAALSVLEKPDQGSREVRICVPADPTVVKSAFEVVVDGNTVTDPAKIVELEGNQEVPPQVFADAHLRLSIDKLFLWDWDSALRHSREVLRISSDEKMRDEALNLSAVSLYMSGRPEEAAGALRKAVEGEWNISLRTNLAAIVMESNPAEAAAEMSYLVGGAGSADEKLAAARNAVRLWRLSRPDSEDDEDGAATIPESLRLSLRALLLADIPEEDFWDIGQFVARTDAKWVRENALLDSRHCDSDTACLIRLRTVGFDEFAKELARRGKQGGHPWIVDSCEEFVLMANNGLIENISSNGHASFAIEYLRAGLDASTQPRILLRVLTTFALENLLDDGDEPIEEIIHWVKQGRDNLHRVDATDEQRQFLTEEIGNAYNVLGRMFGISRENASGDARDAARRIESQLSSAYGRRTANMSAINDVAREIRTWCADTLRIMGMITPHVTDQQLRSALNDFVKSINAIKTFADRFH